MKKFLTAAIFIGVLVLIGFYAALYYGLYIDFHPDDSVKIVFATEGERIVKYTDIKEEEFQIKGVEISASMPEHAASEYAPEKEDYLRWFGQIREMGANAVKVSGIMNDVFYDAFYEFNVESDSPLYLLQSIIVEDAVNYGTGHAYGSDFMERLVEDGKRMVDVIHGKRIIVGNSPGRGSGWYRKDISQWVLGFLIGGQWSEDTIAYTDHLAAYDGEYTGEYFVTSADASTFEAMLAEVMDVITAYESKKYKEQHLIGFSNEPATDPLEYRDDYGHLQEQYDEDDVSGGITYARQLDKICQVDAEHIYPTQKVKAGYFASYSLYDFCQEFYRYLSEEQLAQAADILKDLDTYSAYDGYADFLSQYHTMPVLCSSYGFSTSRGVVSEDGFPLTEEEQGERLVSVYQDLCEAGWSGAFIDSWQDRWELKSWNTAYAQDFTNNSMWHDVQTEAQGYGLMEFVDEGRVIDGSSEEWGQEDILYTHDSLTLSVHADGEGLALLVEGEDVTSESTLYIPIDITEKSGSLTAGSFGLNFSHPADFLICLSGTEDSRMYVQARYESVRSNFLREMSGEDPYISFPDKDADEFLPIYMVMENTTMVEYVNYSNRELKYLPVYETGKLRHGSGSADSPEYDSLADFCYGEGCVEIKIPWALLNFGNPARMLIHDDYYENYGVELVEVDKVRMGVSGVTKEEIPMEEVSLKWEKKNYEERLKRSYEIVGAAWR